MRILVSLCLLGYFFKDVECGQIRQERRGSRKLFGGYRITPRYCKPTRPPTIRSGGPNICMFNHECRQKEGQVVGACMDGFLFGACCQLPPGVSVGEYLDEDVTPQYIFENNLSTRRPPLDITSLGVSQIAESLLNPGVLPTALDNEVVQVNNNQHFISAGVTHPDSAETVLLINENNEIDPEYFKPTTQPTDDRTTVKTDVYPSTPILAISISNAPLEYTTISGFSRPIFKPKPIKPNDNNYIRVPTIIHNTPKNNKTQDYDSIVNILQVLNNATGRPTLATREPQPEILITSRKPPSTSYVFSTTLPPRRTQPTTSKKRFSTKSTKKPSTTFVSSTTKTTWAYSPSAFVTSVKPPSTSYVYSSLPSRKPPPSTISSHIVGPTFSVSSNPVSSTFSTPAPTIIVLGPVSSETETPKPITYDQYPATVQRPSVYEQYPATIQRPTALPQRQPSKPVNHVTINQHVVQNIYSTSPRPPYNSFGSSERPSPTVLITPKPGISSFRPPDYSDTIEIGTIPSSTDYLVDFPPDRNPNLNMPNAPSIGENDITTPLFVEDDDLNSNVESFVNQIIEGLQEPFQGLRDVVNNKKNSTFLPLGTTTKKPLKQATVNKKPVITTLRPGSTFNTRVTTTQRPVTRPVTTSKRPGNKRPTSGVTTKKPLTTIKKTKSTKKPVTTTPTFIEHSTEILVIDPEDYRTECGIRPLVRSAKIVGGKGATFGEFPWQVLVRESTWLGLFTKNKCGGVLISHKYVMTAAHCQPGFLASLVAVFGEFDISGDLEKRRPISRNVKRVIVHRQYDAQTFENDLALLELEQPVQFDQHIIPICLPREAEDFTGRMATVTGWGRLKYGGGVPSVLQEVQVPIMENHVCQEMFRTAGHSKVILESFLCAGYANGQKDSCEGDSGGPLVLQRPDGRYQLAGTVSHGIKCAAPYLPGVYMRTQYFKPWITSITGVTSP